jgi:RHS repeat-associated protein
MTNVVGRLVAEKRAGDRSYFQHDALGNTIALISSGVVTGELSYWPTGEVRESIGTTSVPFKFGGALGYYLDSTARIYVRARYLRSTLSRWMTVDPWWPDESAYGYANGNPTTHTDPNGLAPCVNGNCKPDVVAKKLSAECTVRKDAKDSRYYEIRAYKCMKLSCTTSGTGDPCVFVATLMTFLTLSSIFRARAIITL